MRKFILLSTVLALSACASSTTSTPAQAVFTADSTLAGAEILAGNYKALPLCGAGAPTACASPAVVVQIMAIDTQANTVMGPLVTAAQNGTVITTVEADAAQAAVAALTNYLTSQGIK